MGIYTDLANGGLAAVTASKPRVGHPRSAAEQLLSKSLDIDPNIGSTYAGADEVSVIPEQTDSGAADTYTITVNLTALGVSFTTAAIAYNAVNTVIETAIDVAATAATFPTWTNADISVSMAGAAGISDGTVTLTFDGASVNNTPALVSITPTGFTEVGSTSRTTAGQGDRKATEALYDLNVVEGTLQGSGDVPSWTKPATNGATKPRTKLIKALALQTIVEDGTEDAYDALVALYPQIAVAL